MNRHLGRFLSVAVAALSLSCTDARVPTASTRGTLAASARSLDGPSRHLVLFAAERVPADFGQRVTRLGAAVEASLDSIGVASVSGLGDSAAAALAAAADVRAVEPDPLITQQDDDASAALTDDPASEAVVPADATASPTTAQFYARQWNMRAVFADQAWAAGLLGSRDVKVAILDTGIDYLQPDLVGLVDLERSKSFVPEEDVAARYPGRLPFSDLFWHGTAAASIVASNAKLVAGVNRNVTLIAVKVADSTDAGSAGRLLTGIVYAADQGADVINVSRGHERDKSKNPGVVAAFERAVNYAFRKGALLVSVPFNDAADLDRNGDLVRLPCEAANAICASATGPTGAAGPNGPWENVDAPAPYSAFGRSAIDVAAPGGAGLVGQFRRVILPCTTTPTATTGAPACRAGQLVALGGGLGTSWAAPHVAGLAALLVAQLGHGQPALIRARILQTADDLGEPGVDPYYGKGRINVARALGVIP
jgi:lantibiotic leader peptide-processing serine protease